MISEKTFRKAWNRMWRAKEFLDDGNADAEGLELAEEEYKKNKAIVEKYYDEFF
jgi:hypothetical protein